MSAASEASICPTAPATPPSAGRHRHVQRPTGCRNRSRSSPGHKRPPELEPGRSRSPRRRDSPKQSSNSDSPLLPAMIITARAPDNRRAFEFPSSRVRAFRRHRPSAATADHLLLAAQRLGVRPTTGTRVGTRVFALSIRFESVGSVTALTEHETTSGLDRARDARRQRLATDSATRAKRTPPHVQPQSRSSGPVQRQPDPGGIDGPGSSVRARQRHGASCRNQQHRDDHHLVQAVVVLDGGQLQRLQERLVAGQHHQALLHADRPVARTRRTRSTSAQRTRAASSRRTATRSPCRRPPRRRSST